LVSLVEFLLGRSLVENAAAFSEAESIIVGQLRWTRHARKSFGLFQGDPDEWLKLQNANHGERHRLFQVLKEEESAEETEKKEFSRIPTDIAWIEERELALGAIEKLMKLAAKGNASALESLRSIAVGISRHLRSNHSGMIEKCQDFPVVISAQKELRREELAELRELPLGCRVGFPKDWKPHSYDDSPVGYWRQVQWWLDAMRGLIEESGEDTDLFESLGLAFKEPKDFRDALVALDSFGGGKMEDWMQVAARLVEENPDLFTPKEVQRSADQNGMGLPSYRKSVLRKGLEKCWGSSDAGA
jgi:hypothetical protein